MHDGQLIMRMKHVIICFFSVLGQSRLILYCMVLSVSANDIKLQLEGGASCRRTSFQQSRSGCQSFWQLWLVRNKRIQSAHSICANMLICHAKSLFSRMPRRNIVCFCSWCNSVVSRFCCKVSPKFLIFQFFSMLLFTFVVHILISSLIITFHSFFNLYLSLCGNFWIVWLIGIDGTTSLQFPQEDNSPSEEDMADDESPF